MNNIVGRLLEAGSAFHREIAEISKEPLRHNSELLMQILEQNAQTEFGIANGFSNIHSIEQYKASVPYAYYEDFANAIERTMQGVRNAITATDPPAYYASSGSVGAYKFIPASQRALEDSVLGIFANSLYLQTRGRSPESLKMAFVGVFIDVDTLPTGFQLGDVTSFALQMLQEGYEALFTTPPCSVFANVKHDTAYVHARFALMEPDLRFIGSAYMSDVFGLINYILSHQSALIDDIEKGVIPTDIDLPGEIRSALMRQIQPAPRRADELKKAFAGGSKGILKRLWPRLTGISSIGSTSFAHYTDRVRQYAGEDIDICHLGYGASEGIFGIVTELNSDQACLLPKSVFYEFIPAEHSHEENPQSLTLDQLETGREYEIVVTNTAGLYRYRINDVIKVDGFYNQTPRVVFSYRKSQLVNMAGEKTTDAQMREAVQRCAEHFGCTIPDYAVYPDISSGMNRYLLLIETDAPELKRRAEEVSAVMHEKICEVNPEVLFAQMEGSMGQTVVKFVKPNTFGDFIELRKQRGSMNSQKPVRLIDTPEKQDFFFAHLDDAQ